MSTISAWFSGRARESRQSLSAAWQAPQTADALGTELERQARQLGDRPQGVTELLTRWVVQSDDGEDAFLLDDTMDVASAGEGSMPSALRLTFREALLRSRAFEAALDTCSRLPSLASAALIAMSEDQSQSLSAEGAALASALGDAGERWLLPGARTLWPCLLQALLVGGASQEEEASLKKGTLRWEPWARKVLAAIKRGWQAEALPSLLRQLDRRASDLASRQSRSAQEFDSAVCASGTATAGGAGLSKRGIRAALAREELQRRSAQAADLRGRVEVLCLACERLRAAERNGSSRAVKLERLLEDVNEALASLDVRANFLSSEEALLSSSITEIGGELQKQISGVLLTRQALTGQRETFEEERAELVKRLEVIDSELEQISTETTKCDVQVQQLKGQLNGTTRHFDSKIDDKLRLTKEVNDEKLRAVSYKECAHMALDVVSVEARRFEAEVMLQTKRHSDELRRSLTAYLKQERLRLLACAAVFDAPSSAEESSLENTRDVKRMASTADEAYQSACQYFQRSSSLLGPLAYESGEPTKPHVQGSSSNIDASLGQREATNAGEFFASEAARGHQCADCRSPEAKWASVSHGIYLCDDCAGKHRGLGVHVSFVRSTTMDRWNEKQLRRMQRGGNDKFHSFLRKYPRLWEQLSGAGPAEKTMIQTRYASRAAAFYRSQLDAICDEQQELAISPPPANEGHLSVNMAADARAVPRQGSNSDLNSEEVGEDDQQSSLQEEWDALELAHAKYKSVALHRASPASK